MFSRILFAACLLAATNAFSTTATAEIIFQVESSNGFTFAPNDTGVLSFYLEVLGGDVGAASAGFQLTATAQGVGGANTSDFMFDSAASASGSDYPVLLPDTLNSTASFFRAGGGTFLPAAPHELTARRELFSIGYSIKPGASGFGAFNIDIVTSAAPTRVADNEGGSLTSSFAASPELVLQGQVAVPEPSALSLLMGTSGLLILRRRKSIA